MNDKKSLIEEYKDTAPGIDVYLDCMSRTLFTGLASFWLGFAGFYFAQKIVSTKLPYSRNAYVLVSSFAACGIAYQVTSVRSKSCQARWMAVAEKYTALDELERQATDGVNKS